MNDLRDKVFGRIISVENFPKPGISFKDITGVLSDAEAFRYVVSKMADVVADGAIDKVVGIEARGFILGSAIALDAYAGLILIRKDGKLPRPVFSSEYSLEYGKGYLNIHQADIKAGDMVVVVDDVLATGGTAFAACKLVEMCGGIVEAFVCMIEVNGLGGREKLGEYRVESVFKL